MKMTRREFVKAMGAAGICAGAGTTVRTFAWRGGIKTPLIFDVKQMAVWDGPGIRTTFFVKGCPLKCVWCHNPESIEVKAQWARFPDLCRHCATCTMDEATCPTRALKLYGKAMTMDEIVARALKDKVFYEASGGGVTISGGEPLFFWEWVVEMFKRFKAAGIHTCLDTSLYAPTAAIEALLPVTDMWLPDYKADDDAVHIKYTGVSNKVIKKNLERLVAAKAKMEVRCLVVPGCTEDLPRRYAYLESIGIRREQIVELEYMDLARTKYQALGMKDTMPPKPRQK